MIASLLVCYTCIGKSLSMRSSSWSHGVWFYQKKWSRWDMVGKMWKLHWRKTNTMMSWQRICCSVVRSPRYVDLAENNKNIRYNAAWNDFTTHENVNIYRRPITSHHFSHVCATRQLSVLSAGRLLNVNILCSWRAAELVILRTWYWARLLHGSW